MKFLKCQKIIFLFIFFGSSLFSQNAVDTVSIGKNDPVNMTTEEFKRAVNAKGKLVLIYLKADWCAICKKQRPIIDEVINAEKGKVELVIIDTKDNPLINDYFEVDGLPMLILYKDGNIVWNYLGLIQKNELLKWVRNFK